MRFFDRRSRPRRARSGTERTAVGAPALDLTGPDAGPDAGLDLGLTQALDAAMALAIDAAIRAPVKDAPAPDEPAEQNEQDGQDDERLEDEPAEQQPEGEEPGVPEASDEPQEDDAATTEDPTAGQDGEEAEEEPEEVLITALAPADVTADLANRLSALDRVAMGDAGRNLAAVTPRALLDRIRSITERVWVAGPLSRPIGWAALSTPAGGAVLHGTVAEADRRQGLATRAFEEVLEHAREAGYPAISATIWLQSPGEEFALGRGFQPGSQPPTVIRYQDMYATTERRRRIEEDATSYGSSYEFSTAVEELADGGGTVYRVLSHHVITGIFAGAAELTVTEGAPEFALNGMVRVEPGHRGHRLGTLMSIELIAFVQRTAKKVRMVQVSHPVSDTYITTILDRVGFRVAGLQLEHRLPLS